MAKQGKSTVVPRLRFPEFRGKAQWGYDPLGKLFLERQDSGFIDLPLLSLTEKEGVVPQEETNRKDNSNADKSKYLRVVRGDIVYNTMRMWEGRSAYVGIEGVVSPAYTICAPAEGTYSPFFAFYFKTASLIRLFRKFSQGLVKDTLSLKYQVFSRIEIAHPEDENEQRKIADCLTSLDEVIAAQGRKVEALKTYKRGLMQQLFPSEGEALPRLRFPEFRDEPEWKEVKAGDLFANRIERGDDSLPIYSVTMTDGLVKRASLDRRIDDLADAAGNKKAYRNDIAYNMMRMWQGACGVAYEKCMVSPAYVVLSPQTDVHSPFYGYLFKLPQMLRLLASHSRGLTEDRLRLYYQDFSRIPLPRPDEREQVRIADCLLALDARIVTESGKLADLKTHKSGLMRQLFPSPDEV